MDSLKSLVCAFVALLSTSAVAQNCPIREQVGPQAMPTEIAPIKAPFSMPQLQRPVFPERTVRVKMPIKGIEIYSLGAFIYANGEQNIALTGKGEWKLSKDSK